MMTPHHIILYLLIEDMNECITVDTRCSMSEKHAVNEYPDGTGRYEIRLQGHLGDRWAIWFGDGVITLEEDGDTLLTGPVADQAALHGLLKKVRDLGLPLLSVNFVNPGQVKTPEGKT
jgi:hypothetical protein